MKKLICYSFFFLVLFLSFGGSVQAKEKITLYFFHGEGCPHCEEEQEFLEKLDSSKVKIVEYEVWYHPENSSLMRQVQKTLDVNQNGVPFTVIGTTAIFGYGEGTSSTISRAISYYEEHDYIDVVSQIKKGTLSKTQSFEDGFSKEEAKSNAAVTLKVPLLGTINLKQLSLSSAAVLIGLVDGFNPCAMWVLLFLLGMLVGMKDRKKMWILGFAFLFTSAIVYMILMLSWLQIVVSMTASIWIRTFIAVIALLGGLFNLRSYFKSKEGGCEIVSDRKRNKILTRIRKFTHEKNFLLALMGVIGLAISVNFVELACSAGLPVIFTQLLALNHIEGVSAFGYTFLYILFFLFDDLIIFFISMFTMKVTGLSTKYGRYSHLIGGIFMFVVGALLILKPEWLMFQFN